MSRPRTRSHAPVALATTIVPALLAALVLPASAGATTSTFAYTGAPQTWTAPAGATKATFDVYGAAGSAFDNSGPPDRGGHATATVPVAGTQRPFGIYVGGQGVENAPSGGFNGGGNSDRFPGGGASDVRVGGSALTDRVIVAGGGAGSTTNCTLPGAHPGVGGGLIGGNGIFSSVCNSLFGAQPGSGGTQTAGGTNPVGPGAAGSLGLGGPSIASGGGGGGGYYGGAGGANTGEGGGGSGFGPPGVVFESGVRDGNGLITVSPYFPFTISLLGTGTGRIASTPTGIDCASADPAGCSAEVNGDELTLHATADAGSTFSGWDGAGCSGTADCTIPVDAAKTVRATFAAPTPIITPGAPPTNPNPPAPTPPAASAPFLHLGNGSSSREGALLTVDLQTSGPGTLEAVATHAKPHGPSASRALAPGPGRIVYAAAKARHRRFASTQPLRLRRTAAGRAARFTTRTITLRVVSVFTPDRGGTPIRKTTHVRVRTR